MELAHEEYLYQVDFDAVLDIIESDFLEYGIEFQQDMNLAVEKIPTINNSPSYPWCNIKMRLVVESLFIQAIP